MSRSDCPRTSDGGTGAGGGGATARAVRGLAAPSAAALAEPCLPANCCCLPLALLGRPAGQPKERELRGYTRAQVAQHNTEDDLWLIIKNKGSDKHKVGA